jgi:hypothetical protein
VAAKLGKLLAGSFPSLASAAPKIKIYIESTLELINPSIIAGDLGL